MPLHHWTLWLLLGLGVIHTVAPRNLSSQALKTTPGFASLRFVQQLAVLALAIGQTFTSCLLNSKVTIPLICDSQSLVNQNFGTRVYPFALSPFFWCLPNWKWLKGEAGYKVDCLEWHAELQWGRFVLYESVTNLEFNPCHDHQNPLETGFKHHCFSKGCGSEAQ